MKFCKQKKQKKEKHNVISNKLLDAISNLTYKENILKDMYRLNLLFFNSF